MTRALRRLSASQYLGLLRANDTCQPARPPRVRVQMPVTRTLRQLSCSQYLDQMRAAQSQWAANGTLPSWFDETEWFWVPQRHQVRAARHHHHHRRTTTIQAVSVRTP